MIGRAEAMTFLDSKPVRLISGVGPALGRRLAAEDVHTIGDLQRLPEAELAGRYGKVGARLARLARGEDSRKVEPDSERKSLSSEITLEHDVADPDDLKRALWRQCEKVARGLKKEGLAGRTITLKLKSSDFKLRTRSISLANATQLADVIYRTAGAPVDARSRRHTVPARRHWRGRVLAARRRRSARSLCHRLGPVDRRRARHGRGGAAFRPGGYSQGQGCRLRRANGGQGVSGRSMTRQRNLTRRRVLAATLSLAALSVVESAWAVPLRATPRQGAGPFYPHEIPLDSDNDLVNVAGRPRPASGTVAHVMGRVVDTDGGPISGTRVEIWQCDAFGVYHHVGGRGGSGADPKFSGLRKHVRRPARRLSLSHHQASALSGPDAPHSLRPVGPRPAPHDDPALHRRPPAERAGLRSQRHSRPRRPIQSHRALRTRTRH